MMFLLFGNPICGDRDTFKRSDGHVRANDNSELQSQSQRVDEESAVSRYNHTVYRISHTTTEKLALFILLAADSWNKYSLFR